MTEKTSTELVLEASRRAAELAHPLFEAGKWVWHDEVTGGEVPTVDNIASTYQELVFAILLAPEEDRVGTGRLYVDRDPSGFLTLGVESVGTFLDLEEGTVETLDEVFEDLAPFLDEVQPEEQN